MTQDFSAYAMATPGEYTETLGNLIAFGYDTDDKLHLSADYYPIYDEDHRAELNEKIVRHYALREIGQETAQQFVFYLGMTMAEIMPYFNERYRTLDMEYNPLDSMDMTTDSENGSESQSSGKASSTQDSTGSSTSKSDNNSTTTSKSFDSDVPQTGVVGDFHVMPVMRTNHRRLVRAPRPVHRIQPVTPLLKAPLIFNMMQALPRVRAM